jgi:hypothetical protein
MKLRNLLVEIIRHIDGKWVVYSKTGGKRLGTHTTYKSAVKQLQAIEVNKQKTEGAPHFNTGLSGKEDSTAERNFNQHHHASMYGDRLGSPAEEETYDWDDSTDKIPGLQSWKHDWNKIKRGYEPVKKKQYNKMDSTFKDDYVDDLEHIHQIGESRHTIGNIYKGKIKIGGTPVPLEVELRGADHKNRTYIVKVLHIDSQYHSKLPKDGILNIPSRLFDLPGGGWVKLKTPNVF